MAAAAPDNKVEKSYLSSAVDSINPWAAGRSTTPTRTPKQDQDAASSTTARPEDHSITHLYGQSFKTYPSDCPPLKVQWYHAVDVPKRKPRFNSSKQTSTQPEKPQAPPKKYSAFSTSDSRALENEYQKLLEAMENDRDQVSTGTQASSRKRKAEAPASTRPQLSSPEDRKDIVRVPVSEDFLFDVDIEARELAPVYWLGPVYEVRRGTWFYQEGSSLRPCEENLAAQLEEGYLKLKPWRYLSRDHSPLSAKKVITPKASGEKLNSTVTRPSTPGSDILQSDTPAVTSQSQGHPNTYRLFGTYMNSIVTYQDVNTAWLSSEGMLSWVTSSVYQRFAGGGYMSGIKLIRGYAEPSKSKEKEKEKEKEKGKEKNDDSRPATPENALALDERQQKLLKRRSAPPLSYADQKNSSIEKQPNKVETDPRQGRLQRQLSSLLESEGKTKAEKEEDVRRREEQEIQEDYNAQAGETQGREIEHLVLVTHGIGQLLSLRMESVNFVHDVNILRKTMKSVYSNSADLKALNSEFGSGPGNCRVQVLPVCWRHLLDFPKKREKKGEQDIGEVGEEEDDYPSLDDITIEGVAFARSLISDLALDVLLYQSAYRNQIARIVLLECNRIYKLFRERNPEFNGKVHLMGHSLGSAILFDLLCEQRHNIPAGPTKTAFLSWSNNEPSDPTIKNLEVDFNFEVDDFYCLGSPIGLFQMLKGQTIGARPRSLQHEPGRALEGMAETSRKHNPSAAHERVSRIGGLPDSVASPKIQQLYNIFHPSDPISYRLEPLISPSMSSLKPQQLPYTKRGIFGTVAPQGLTGIGAKVGQSVSGLWSSLSAGIASNLLNRSLGLTSDDVARINANETLGQPRTEVDVTDAPLNTAHTREATDARMKMLAENANANRGVEFENGGHDPTLIDVEIETLYSKFKQSRDVSNVEGEMASKEEDRKSRRLRREEEKVRALNRNGRVDYSIQESVLDFNPMNTIASHMCYWADEDVNHFVLSQLLSSRTK